MVENHIVFKLEEPQYLYIATAFEPAGVGRELVVGTF